MTKHFVVECYIQLLFYKISDQCLVAVLLNQRSIVLVTECTLQLLFIDQYLLTRISDQKIGYKIINYQRPRVLVAKCIL